MAVHHIFVSVKGKGPHLNFQENGHTEEGINFETEVLPGDTIIWHAEANSGIHSFVGVRMYDNDTTGTDMLKDVTANGDMMSAKIFTPASVKHGELHENYFVQYKTKANGPVIEEDPKLKMRGTKA